MKEICLKLIRVIAYPFCRVIYHLLAKIKLVKPSVIVLVDGGICSQMYQYLMGYYLKVNNNYTIEFNIGWYESDGRDANGNSVRNFDLLKVFPHLEFPIASKIKCEWYNRLFPYFGYSSTEFRKPWWSVTPPVSILGYFAAVQDMYAPFSRLFSFNAPDVLDEKNFALYNEIPTENSVAVHVRRGDLSVYRVGYGNPVTEDYYQKAIRYFWEKDNNMVFYFFSDDKNYLSDVLVPSIPFTINSVIVENGDDKGYYDLLLISRCKHQITSKGSLGKFGAMLSDLSDKTVIVSKDDKRTYMLQNFNFKIVTL